MSNKYTLETVTKRAHEIIKSEGPYNEEDIEDIIGVTLSFVLHEIDFNIAETLCEKFILSDNESLKMLAITCVADIAVVYRRQVNSTIMEEIYKLYQDRTYKHWGEADATLDQLEVFFKISRPKRKS